MKNNKNRSNETSVIAGSIIAAVCILIYVVALIQGSFRLINSVENNKKAVERELRAMKYIAEESGQYGFMSQKFLENINNVFIRTKAMETLIITWPEGEYPFKKQNNLSASRFSFTKQSHIEPLNINNVRNVNIKAIYKIYNYEDFNQILRDTLLFILIGFVISFITMLVQMLLKQGGSDKPALNYQTIKTPSAPIYMPPPPAQAPSYRNHYQQQTDTAPKGLYSSRSNIGWEEYTLDRLDAELHRCASTEKDLTIVNMEFSSLTNDEWFAKAAEEAVSFFSSRDLLFECGYSGITVILPGIDLDTGISKAQKFFQRICEKFQGANLSIGLSSRAGRLINGERIMLECSEALKKAKADPKSPIIGFRSDPEKYRAFISQNA